MELASRARGVRGTACAHGALAPAAAATRALLPRPVRPAYTRRQLAPCSALGPGGGKGPQDGPLKKLAQEAERHAHNLIDTLTPKHEYDLADVTLIFVSTLVFMWLAANMYRLYAFCYYSGGHHAAALGGAFFGSGH